MHFRLDEYRAIWPTQRSYTWYSSHSHCCRTNFFQTALRNTFAGYQYHVNTQLSGPGAREQGGGRVGHAYKQHTNRLQHPGGSIGPPRSFSS